MRAEVTVPRGDQHMEALGRQPLHQRQQRQTFADAGPMQPGQPALGPRQAGDAAPFAKPFARSSLPRWARRHRNRAAERREAVRRRRDRRAETVCVFMRVQSHIPRLAALTPEGRDSLVQIRRTNAGAPLPFFWRRFPASRRSAAPCLRECIRSPAERRAPRTYARSCGKSCCGNRALSPSEGSITRCRWTMK